MSHRTTVSRVEVLVAVSIVVVLGGLLLAATGRVRESAARTTCQNNLRQLGFAVRGHHDTYDRLPPLIDQGEGAPTGGGIPSAFAIITPYLEANPWSYYAGRTPNDYHAHSSIAFTVRNKDGGTGTLYGGIANQTRRSFIDPADTTARDLRDVPVALPDGTTGNYAAGSYVLNGLLPWGKGELTDSGEGANTILIAERPRVCRTASGETVYNLWGVGFYSPHMPAFATLTPTDPVGLWSTGQMAPVVPLPDDRATDRNTRIQYRVGRRDAAPQLPYHPAPIQILGKDRPCDPRLPGSPHLGGMQVLMSDVSIRVFGPGTDPWVFWAACVPPENLIDRR